MDSQVSMIEFISEDIESSFRAMDMIPILPVEIPVSIHHDINN